MIPTDQVSPPQPAWLPLLLALGAWWALALLLALAWLPAWGWHQAHEQAAGRLPGAIATQVPILAVGAQVGQDPPTSDAQLWLNLPDRGLFPVRHAGPAWPEWKPGALVAIRRAPAHPQVLALDLPDAEAFTAMQPWTAMLGEPFFLALLGLSGLGALGSSLACLAAWRRPAWELPSGLRLALGLFLVASGLVAWVIGTDLMAIAKPERRFGEAALVQVAPGPKPPEPQRVWVHAPTAWGPLGGRRSVAVGRLVAPLLGPQHQLVVLSDFKRQRVVFEGFVPGMGEEAAFVEGVERVLWAAPGVWAFQGLLLLGSVLYGWRRFGEAHAKGA